MAPSAAWPRSPLPAPPWPPTRRPTAPSPRPSGPLFIDRSSGWTGADGVYSIPLSGDERPGSAAGSGRTLILFSDTFVGTVNADKSRAGTVMVNNSTALLTGDQPDAAKLQFNVRTKTNGSAISMVLPKQPDDPSERFWPSDGVVVDGKVYTFAMRIKDADTPPCGFATAGASLLWADAAETAPFAGKYGQKDSPLIVLAKPAATVRPTSAWR